MSYETLVAGFTRYYRFQHLAQIVAWDQAAMMPPRGNDARGAAMAELAVLMHGTLVGLGNEFAGVDASASVREMRRQWRAATVLPADLVEEKSLAGSRCEHAWRTQRREND